jgi:hypothetical protein
VQYNLDIWTAARKNDLGTVKKLLAQGTDINALDDEGATPLHVRCCCGVFACCFPVGLACCFAVGCLLAVLL